MTPNPLQPDGDEIQPDVTGMVLLLAVAVALLGWMGRTPGVAATGLLLAGMATAVSVAAWSATMWLTRRRSPVFRVGAATVASAASVSLYLAARAEVWPVFLQLILMVGARMERPPGHRIWRHAALAVSVALAAVAVLTW